MPPRAHRRALVLLLCLGAPQLCHCRITRIAVLPHGDFAYDPSLIDGVNGSLAIHNASVALGADISAHLPDVLFVITPHGVALSNDFAVSLSTNASGFASIGGDLHNASFPSYAVPMTFGLRSDVAATVLAALDAAAANVSGILPFADSEPMAVRWGEVVPLLFMNASVNNTYAPRSHVVLWSQPLRRYNDSVQMIPELLKIGSMLFDALDALPDTVCVTVSADLAHTHPNPVQPYPANGTAAAAFDAAVVAWARTLNSTALVVDAAAHAPYALSCGFTGLVIADGMLGRAVNSASAASVRDTACRSPVDGQHDGVLYLPPPPPPQNCSASRSPGCTRAAAWTSAVLAYEAPTYYGMVVADIRRSLT